LGPLSPQRICCSLRKHGRNPGVAIYYSSSSPSNENEADLQELSKIRRLRKKVRSKSMKCNMIGRYIRGKPTSETTREMDVGNKLIAYLDVQTLNPKIKLECSEMETTESTKNKLPADCWMNLLHN
jgi:hypothetical protein